MPEVVGGLCEVPGQRWGPVSLTGVCVSRDIVSLEAEKAERWVWPEVGFGKDSMRQGEVGGQELLVWAREGSRAVYTG